MAYDLLVKNGRIIDGTGAPAYPGNLAVQDGKIAGMGEVSGTARRVVDVDGLTVAPGFFDLHTHYDAQLMWDPSATSSCWHGVTTVVTGNCGYSIAPVQAADHDYMAQFMAYVEGIPSGVLTGALDWDWSTFGDYLRRFRGRLGVNMAPQVGHSALRYYVMGTESLEREATSEEVAQMKDLLREAFAAGAMGLSSSRSRMGNIWVPVPSRQASVEELVDLAGVLSEFGRGMVTMDPAQNILIEEDDLEILVSIARAAGRPAVWTQLMHQWDRPDAWRHSIRLMAEAQSQGDPVYTVASCRRLDREFNLARTSMFDAYPTWKDVLARPTEERKEMLASSDVRGRMLAETTDGDARFRRRLEGLEIKRTTSGEHKGLEGTLVKNYAASQGQNWVEAMLDLALEEDLQTQFIFNGVANGDPKAVEQIVQSPHALPGASDAGAHLDAESGVDYTSILLGQCVRDEGFMTLEEGVRRLTSMSAEVLGVKDRGTLKEGMAADLVVFDPLLYGAKPREVVGDLPGGVDRIIQRAVGVQAVIVNGQVLVEDNETTDVLPGCVLGLT